MTIREIRFDGFSPVAVLDNGTFDSFDARRFDVVVEDARRGVIDLDNTFHIELDDADDDLAIDVDDDALALADNDFDDVDAYLGDDFDLRIDPNGWRRPFMSATKTRKTRRGAGFKLRRRRPMVK